MSAVTETISQSEILSQKFADNLAQRKSVEKPYNPIATKTELPAFNSSSVAPSLSKYSGPAFLAFLGLDAAISKTKEAYYDKMKELGIGIDVLTKYKTSSPAPTPTPDDDTASSSVPAPEPPAGSTLLSVLQGSSHNVSAVSKSIDSNTHLLSLSFSKLFDLMDNQFKVQVAYNEAFLENIMNLVSAFVNPVAVPDSDTSIAYKEAQLDYNNKVLEQLTDISSKLSVFDSGIEIKRTQDEVNLTNAKLRKTNFELTPIQLDNIEGEIPELSPVEMRAVKDAVVAKKHSDENTFNLDNEEQDTIMNNTLPDLSPIFDFMKKSERLPTQAEIDALFA